MIVMVGNNIQELEECLGTEGESVQIGNGRRIAK